MTERGQKIASWAVVAVVLTASGGVLYRSIQQTFRDIDDVDRTGGMFFEQSIGENSPKIRTDGDRQYLWASGALPDGASWFDLTGSPLKIDRFQFGIGKDSIRAIDEPVIVPHDDPRLAAKWGEQFENLEVLGFVHNGQARAYPVALMSQHELVNDTVGGKPVTVGW